MTEGVKLTKAQRQVLKVAALNPGDVQYHFGRHRRSDPGLQDLLARMRATGLLNEVNEITDLGRAALNPERKP